MTDKTVGRTQAEGQETQIHSSVYLPLPIEQVFAYITTSGNWPSWHPASQAVSGQTDLPMRLGDQVEEQFQLAGYHGEVTWTVAEHKAPHYWRIEGAIQGCVRGVITYTFTPDEHGTLFERTFAYRVRRYWHTLFNRFFFRRFMEAESQRALRRLRAVITASHHQETPFSLQDVARA